VLVPASSTPGWSLLYYRNVDAKASIKGLAKLPHPSAEKYFLTFSLLDVP
jgi:hypothetical protein